MLINYIEVAPGMVRIDSKIGNLLTLERGLEEAKRLLEGTSIQKQNLKDLSSRDLHDSMLLSKENLEKGQNPVHTVVFSIEGKDIIVNKKNIGSYFKSKNENKTENQVEVIREAVEESFERG